MGYHEQIERLRSQLTEHTTSFVLFYQGKEDLHGECTYGGNYLACHHLVECASDSFTEQVTADCEAELEADFDDDDDDDWGDQLAKL